MVAQHGGGWGSRDIIQQEQGGGGNESKNLPVNGTD